MNFDLSNLLSGVLGSLIGASMVGFAYWHSSLTRAKKELRDVLYELQDKIVHPPKEGERINYIDLFRGTYPEVRKRTYELAFWNFIERRKILRALRKYAGNSYKESSLEELKGEEYRWNLPILKGNLYSVHLAPENHHDAMERIYFLTPFCEINNETITRQSV